MQTLKEIANRSMIKAQQLDQDGHLWQAAFHSYPPFSRPVRNFFQSLGMRVLGARTIHRKPPA